MRLLLFFLLSLSIHPSVGGQSLTHTDLIDLSSCPDFDCFEKSVISKGITLKENPYKDAFGGRHQLIFNSSYDQPNIEVYSVGLTFKNDMTTVLLRSKNKDYLLKVLESLFVWGRFEDSVLNQMDEGTKYSIYRSKNHPGYSLRVEMFYDNDDQLNYYVAKLTRPTKTPESENKPIVAKTEPAIEIKTKTHSLQIYSGWSGIFKNPENTTWLRSDYGGKEPPEIFKEAPDGWLKSAPYLYSINIKFEETESYTFEKARQSVVDWAARLTHLPKDKIKLVEEQVTLPDGRKGQILFYVCPDMNGMIDGNSLHCELAMESATNKNNLIQYTIIIEGSCPDLPQAEAIAWKDYFKKVLMTIKPN
jgi:hypothetical protein